MLLVPGNHERARVSHPLLAIEDGLHVFERPGTVIVTRRGVRAAFFGVPYTQDVRRRFVALVDEARGRVISAVGCDTDSANDSAIGPADVRVLCVHHCVEGATCGPGDFTFRRGPDVIRRRDLPADVVATLSGHIHRHQVLPVANRGPLIYAGSVERTSFAEASETKGFVVLDLTRDGLGAVAFHPLPARPMATVDVRFSDPDPAVVAAHLSASLAATPEDAVVRVRVEGSWPSSLSAATLRRLAGARKMTLVSSRHGGECAAAIT